MADSDLMALLLETAIDLHSSGKLHVFEGDMIIMVPYLKEKPDGGVVRENSLRLLHGRAKCHHRK